MPEASTCSSCKQPILWRRTGKGKAIPIDPEPCPDGNILMHVGGLVAVLTKRELVVMTAEVPRFKSHFATCPHARSHRK